MMMAADSGDGGIELTSCAGFGQRGMLLAFLLTVQRTRKKDYEQQCYGSN